MTEAETIVVTTHNGSSIFVAYVPGQGRGVFASRDIGAGEIVYQEEPYVMVPLITRHGDQTCLYCVKQFPRPKAADWVSKLQCDRCHEFYCSPECRVAGEKEHVESGECTALYRTLPVKGDLSTDDFNNLRGIAAMVMKCKKEGKEKLLNEKRPKKSVARGSTGVELVIPKLAVCEPEKMDLQNPATDFTVVASLTTNITLFDDEQMETFQECFEAYEVCVEAQSESDEDTDEEEEEEEAGKRQKEDIKPEEEVDSKVSGKESHSYDLSKVAKLPVVSDWMFEKLACAYQCNGFSIWNEHKKESCSGVYGFAAMINHSCIPNITKTFARKTLNFVAKSSIKKGEQLFISYVDVTLSYNLRQWRLSHQYYIEQCSCKLCQAGR